jgi:hypothetical protein
VTDQQLHTEGQGAPQYLASPEGLKEALSALGETADEIAASLQAQGIKGERSDAQCCPVARYLDQRFPGWEPDVQGAYVSISHYEHGNHPGIHHEVDVESIAAFVEAFDDEQYPALDEHPREDEGDEPGHWEG